MTNLSKKDKFNKQKYLEDLASTPLISLALGEASIDISDYIIEEINIKSN